MAGCGVVVSFVLAVVAMCGAVIMPEEASMEFSENEEDFNSVFRTCLRREAAPGAGGVLGCAGRGAVAGLTGWEVTEALSLGDGLKLERAASADGHAPREALLSPDADPTDLGSVAEAAAAFLGRRALRWDMSALYPGLALHVGPTLGGAGVLHFALDRSRLFSDRQLTTGRLLFRRLVLPLLLGLKVKLVTLVPIFFLAMVLLAKKALFVSKLALLVSGFLGLNSLFLLQQPQLQQQSAFQRPLGGLSILQQQPAAAVVQDDPVDPIDPGHAWFEAYSSHGFRGAGYDEQRRDARGGRNFAWEGERRQKP